MFLYVRKKVNVLYKDKKTGLILPDSTRPQASGYSEAGASRIRRALRSFHPHSTAPSEDIDQNNHTLRQRGRMLYMSSPVATSAINTNRTKVVGVGLTLKSSIDHEALGLTAEQAKAWQKHTEKEFALWANDKASCDATGMNDFIMCACDTVKVNPSSLIMIHKCWETLWGGYNADELREEAAACEAWDKAQASIYKRKCGLDEAEITRMMAATTYMTGQEAIDKGFADTLLEDAQPLDIAASADGRSLFVRGQEFHLCPGMFAPDNIPTVSNADADFSEAVKKALIAIENSDRPRRSYGIDPEAKAPAKNTPPANDVPPASRREEITGEGGNQMEENKTQTPAAQESAPAPAVDLAAAERRRLQEIDAIAALYDPALVQEAKYGEKPCTAQELAYRAAVEAAAKAAGEGKAFMAAMAADNLAAAAVSAAPASEPPKSTENMTPEQRMADARNEVKALLGKKEC